MESSAKSPVICRNRRIVHTPARIQVGGLTRKVLESSARKGRGSYQKRYRFVYGRIRRVDKTQLPALPATGRSFYQPVASSLHYVEQRERVAEVADVNEVVIIVDSAILITVGPQARTGHVLLPAIEHVVTRVHG